MTHAYGIELSPDLFASIFPFHIAFDHRLRVTQLGRSITRLCSNLGFGGKLTDQFSIHRPAISPDFEGIKAAQDLYFVLDQIGGSVRLRGQMQFLPDYGVIVFLCSPWITEPGDLSELGLTLNDFAIHDPFGDFLQLLHSKGAALSDLKKLNAKLVDQKEALHQANAKLAAQCKTLQNAQAITNSILDTAADAIITLDSSGSMEIVNPSTERLFGYASGELIGRNVSMLIPEGDSIEGHANLSTVAMNHQLKIPVSTGEMLGRRKDGSTFPIYLSVGVVPTEDSFRFTAILLDITNRKRVENALQESEARYRSVVDNVKEVIFQTDERGRWSFLNPAWKEITGFEPEEALGRSFLDFVHPLDRERNAELFAPLVAGEKQYCRHEVRYLTKSGGSRWIEVFARLTLDLNGNIIGTSGTLTDVTVRRETALALQKAKDAAEAVSRAKGEFLANISHEIRTPMNAVIGMTGLLLGTSLNAEQRDYTETIRSSGDALLTLLNRVLDFSKIESGSLELDNAPFLIIDAIEDALLLLAPAASEKGLELNYLISPDTPIELVGDVGRVRQILVNLIGNAIKFTSVGEVLVSVAAQPVSSELYSFQFTVRDTGIGIPPERADRLFMPFSQVDASTTRQYGGTGLGLAISKRLAEMMGGTMWLESAEGVGSVFHFTVAAKLAGDRRFTSRKLPFSGICVQVVSDRHSVRLVLRNYLEIWQMQVATSRTIREAVQSTRNGKVDLIILDGNLPELNVRSITGLSEGGAGLQIPIILLEPIGTSKDSSFGELPQVIHSLAKPIRHEVLLNAIIAALGGAPAPKLGTNAISSIDTTLGERIPLRILLVEDHPVNQKVARLMLGKLGYRADSVSNGIEAVRAVERREYDVLLMDVQMPEMDGREATRRIRSLSAKIHQPWIVAMTASATTDDRAECLNSGMNDFVSKPMRPNDLEEAIEKAGQAIKQRHPTPLDDHIISSMKKNIGGNDEVLEDIFTAYLSEAEQTLQDLEMARRNRDLPATRKKAHYLKGSSALVGAAEVAAACKYLEGISDPDSGELSELLAELGSAFKRTEQAVDEMLARNKRNRT